MPRVSPVAARWRCGDRTARDGGGMESTPAINQESMMDEFSTPAPVAAVVDVPAGRC